MSRAQLHSLVVALKYFHMNGLPDLFFMMRVMVAGLVSPKRTPSWCKGLFLADGVLVMLMDGVLGAYPGQSRISKLAT